MRAKKWQKIYWGIPANIAERPKFGIITRNSGKIMTASVYRSSMGSHTKFRRNHRSCFRAQCGWKLDHSEESAYIMWIMVYWSICIDCYKYHEILFWWILFCGTTTQFGTIHITFYSNLNRMLGQNKQKILKLIELCCEKLLWNLLNHIMPNKRTQLIYIYAIIQNKCRLSVSHCTRWIQFIHRSP